MSSKYIFDVVQPLFLPTHPTQALREAAALSVVGVPGAFAMATLCPALVLAAKLNHPAILKELLAAGPEEVDQADSDGLAALHYACIEGRKKLVELLLGHGADPTLKTKAGDAPITLVHPEQRQIRSLIGDAAGRRFAH